MKRLPAFIALLVLVLLFTPAALTEPASMGTTVTSLRIPPFQFGVHLGSQMSVSSFDQMVGRKADINVVFLDLTDDFPWELAEELEAQHKTLMVYWETKTGLDPILAGEFDEHLTQFARDAQSWGGPILMVPLHEMNLNEGGSPSWGFSEVNTPEKFKQVWRHLHSFFEGMRQVEWGIAYNVKSIPYDPDKNTFAAYYPGDEYVDHVGISGFNWTGRWSTFSTIMDAALKKLHTFGKPIWVFATASGQDTVEPWGPWQPLILGEKKGQWIKGMFAYMEEHPEIVGLVWFNENKELNWPVDSSPSSLEAFRLGLQH